MKQLMNIRRFKIYLFAGFLFLCFGLLTNIAQYRESYFAKNVDDAWRLIYVLLLNYVLFEYTIPRLSWKKFIRSFVMLFTHIVLYSYGLYQWRQVGIAIGFYTPLTPHSIPATDPISAQMAYSVGSIVFFAIVRHIYNHVKLKRSAQQLRIEKQEAELNFLKSQTNPHFLFNTLNNIYSLARDKSDLAAESILRLSQMLRYMLYEANVKYVAIEQELKIINDFIALEKLRYDDSLRVNFNCDVENMKQSLPPLLLIPLVENAFKHGVSETRGAPFIDIHLSVNNRKLSFIVKNSTGSTSLENGAKENIGLTNLRRQLELLYSDYQFSVQQTGHLFTAMLKINLASHV